MRLTFPYRETWLHRINPSFKLIGTMALLIGMLFIQRLDTTMYLSVLLLLVLFTSTGHPLPRLLLYASPFLLIFLSGMSTMTLFGKGEHLWFVLGPVHVSRESLLRGLNIGFRGLGFSAGGLLFALTTRPVLLFYSLMQQLRVSPKYAYSFMAGIRLMPIMLEELQTLRYALQVRGVEKRGFSGLWLKLKRYSVPMLAQSIRRAQRVAVAMEAKRFSFSRERTFYYGMRLSRYDVYALAGLAALVLLALWAGVRYPLFGVADVRQLGN